MHDHRNRVPLFIVVLTIRSWLWQQPGHAPLGDTDLPLYFSVKSCLPRFCWTTRL